MDKKNQLKKLLPMILMVAVSVAIGITGATVLHTLTLENPIKTPTVEGEVKEEDLDKGGKKISFENTGEADVFVRASISESWTGKKDGKDCILPNEVNGKKIARPFGNVEGTTASIESVPNGGSDWVYNPSDGWYYYKKVLPGSRVKGNSNSEAVKQAKTTKLLVEGVKFDELKTGLNDSDENIRKAYEVYKDATYELHVTMEVVQASDETQVSKDAVQKMFFNNQPLPSAFLSDWPAKSWLNETNHDRKYQVVISWLGQN